MAEYAELHCHSNYSFLEGASSIEELVVRARELDYRGLALTDHDNLCGAMSFAHTARAFGLVPITGAEVTLTGGGHLTLLAATTQGYGNLCQVLSLAHVTTDRRHPELDPRLLAEHAEGLVILTGCAQGPIPRLLMEDRTEEAQALARQYQEWFGEGNVYLELQRNLAHGDTERVKRLVRLGRETGISLVATNNVHYHVQERHRLQDCLVAIRHRKSLEASHRERRPNSEFHLKSPVQMARLFRSLPEALRNTLAIAERCTFDVTRDLSYRFPDYPVPPGHTPLSYLEQVCREAAMRRYGRIDARTEERLREELRRVERHRLAGFFLLYKDLVDMAHEVQVELGHVDRETPLEVAPPGRGRGSSVAMLIGYLIGLSHVDPLVYDLGLDRFLPDEPLAGPPDIDLDFPRDIREKLIERVHERWGWERAALTGMIATYQAKGAIRDLGLALGLPAEDIDKLAKRVEHAVAFGITAFQSAHLKAYFPVEFYTALLNAQPMGFYSIETIKEDARRHGVAFLHPDVNRSQARCVIEGEAIRLGLLLVRDVGRATAERIVGEREARGPFRSVAEFMERTGLQQAELDSLADGGAFDALAGDDQRRVRWEIGLRYAPARAQRQLPLPVDQDMAPLPKASGWERMVAEYRTLGLHPEGHVMAHLREKLPSDVLTSEQVEGLEDGVQVRVAGLVIRRQRPLAKAVFMTLEDEFGHIPLAVWPQIYERLRHVLKEPVLMVTGTVSRREGTMNVVVQSARVVQADQAVPRSKDWG